MSINIKDNFKNWLDLNQKKSLLKFLTCGSVDDGKSTLIGRLLHDTQQIYDDQLSSLKNDSKRHGTQGNKIDLALIVDGLQSEREQGITIDVAYRYFSTHKRKFIIADTPGHEQYTRNMVTGASTCDLSILLIDARKGLSEQTYRHSFISTLLGIKDLVVAINKMDLVNYKEEIFINIKKKFLQFSKKLPENLNIMFIPISALIGENIVFKSHAMPWYNGSTLLDILETIKIQYKNNSEEIRFPVQYINRPNSEFRGYSGTLLSGSIHVGQLIKILPININSRITNIVTFDKNLEKAEVGQAITIVLKDEIDINRGDFFVNTNSLLKPSQEAIIDVVWMIDDLLLIGGSYNIKLSGKKTRVYIKEILFQIDINTLIKRKSDSLSLNSIGRIKVMFSEPMIFDNYDENRMTGNIIFIDFLTNITVGAGMIKSNLRTKKPILHDQKKDFELDLHAFVSKHFPHWNIPKLVMKKVSS
ncbi:sulfate adenylyltransferase subunit CysN [Buchnera aphidicola]|uniref:Sulfate adenylyltransferase subunit 1 n=1 Tax=Buchnera aphidicola str. USDA (Myzus persicae) TaxID=1009856 RepID=W0P3E9_BUCMP|nr:sulfate adenylyltransferase subunit CysN [Buchnera aphidicola]AHG59972.1 Cysn [Buchnera aphidicola str. USDA (Myzus persicae)]AHG60552.1 Cysn [Buchnera aphidicola str. W106 (Myzus persicae)]AHG61125.1 Cysn [Buchnera aphidicola str. G002 (Myzus persicae)]AHG61697.1 Cysn [Buchnera aphidicola str. F009 (Myzus persicae)]WAI03346.1 MAG: sulfate adenylyltransferase subunit CysN [Buchnera aphidicola (Myzus persicae)]